MAISGISVDFVTIDTSNKPAELLALNPKGTVPVMLLPRGQVLTSSNDILSYIGSQVSSSCLAFTGPKIIELHDFADRTLGAGTREWIFSYRDRPEKDMDPVLLDGVKQTWVDCLQQLECWIEGEDYFLGVGPSLADCALIPRLALASHYGLKGIEKYPRLSRWFFGVQSKAWYRQAAPFHFLDATLP